jgi:hypothetical protein
MTAGKLSAASWCYVRTVRLVSGPFRKVECLFQSAQSHSYGSIEMHVLALCGSHWPAPCLAVCHVNIKLATHTGRPIYIVNHSGNFATTFYLAQAKMSKSCAFHFQTTQQQVPGSTWKMSITSTYDARDTLTEIWSNDDACKLISCHFIFLVRN